LLDSPNDSPDVQHHEPAESPADTDGQKTVALPSVSVQREVKPRSAGDYQRNDQAKHRPFLHGFQRGLEQRYLDSECQSPNPKNSSNRAAAAGLGIVRVGGDDHHPVPDTGENRDQRGPAEPPQGPRHKDWNDSGASRSVDLL